MTTDKGRVRLTVILVTHNESRFLINWIEKMRAQWQGELIVVDNCSTDNSVELVRSAYPDIKILQLQENTGPFGGFIAGCKATDSEFVACYSPDDEIGPSYIDKMIEAINKYPIVDLYTCNTEVIREGMHYERILFPYTAYISPDYAVKLCQNGYNKNFNLCGLIVKRDIVLKMWEEGGKDIDVNFDCLFTFYTIFDKGFVNVGEKLFVYHSYPASWGAARNRDKIWKAIESQLSIYKKYPHVYARAIASKVFSTERHLISGLAVKHIMKFPKWIRKILYKKIYEYNWRAEKL
jgi:glycosyltransferase involved in cell wall biosynthesis